MIFVYVTCKNKNQASKITKHLMNKKLAACSNIFPITSLFNWKGKLNNEKEYVTILKTFNKNFKKIIKEIEKIHPYEIPFIGKLNIQVNKKYEAWAKKELK